MHVIHAENVNDAYRYGMRLILSSAAEESPSRNGPVLRMNAPVSTVYAMPHERVLFDAKRHANPFFHLFEALWMLAGCNDVETMDGFLKSFKEFSDDGITFHGAYGHRWRHWPIHTPTYMQELDQISVAIAMLKKDPTSRRVVIGMWDPVRDLNKNSKDIPCNDMIKLWVDQTRRLHMVVFNRSNDVVWGCYGANAVHMSILHEYISAMVDVVQGTLTQISCDFHAYLETPYDVTSFVPSIGDHEWQNPYHGVNISWHRLVNDPESFDHELWSLMDMIRRNKTALPLDPHAFKNTFFGQVAIPMHIAWEYIRDGDRVRAMKFLEDRQAQFHEACANDWIQNGIEWIQEAMRRTEAKQLKEA